MPDGIVNFMISVFRLCSKKNCRTTGPTIKMSLVTFSLIICSSSDRAMHCTRLVFVHFHFISLKDDFTKTETLARTLHDEQAFSTAHYLRPVSNVEFCMHRIQLFQLCSC